VIADGAVVKAGDRVLAFDDSPFTSKLQEKPRAASRGGAQVPPGQGTARRSASRTSSSRFAGSRNDRDKAKLQADLPSDLTVERVVQANTLTLLQSEAALTRAGHELTTMIEKNALEERARQIDLDKTRRTIDTAEHAITALVVKAPKGGVIVVDADPGGRPQVPRRRRGCKKARRSSRCPISPSRWRSARSSSTSTTARVSLHMAGTCTLDGYPDGALPCLVEAVAPVARPKDQGSLRHSFGVTLALGHGDPARLRPGMAVKVELPRPRVHALVIPRDAILPDGASDGTHVRVRLATGELHDVTLAACDAQHCAIASGLAKGDIVSIRSSRSLGAVGADEAREAGGRS